jgi:hypothetical protein
MYLEERVARIEQYLAGVNPILNHIQDCILSLEHKIAGVTPKPEAVSQPVEVVQESSSKEEAPAPKRKVYGPTLEEYKARNLGKSNSEKFDKSYVVKRNGCWAWKGTVEKRNGIKHPVLHILLENGQGRRIFSRNYSYSVAYPKEYAAIQESHPTRRVVTTELCGNSLCVNPEHIIACCLIDYRFLVKDFNEGRLTLANRTPVYKKGTYTNA